jgi:hypothetical protein
VELTLCLSDSGGTDRALLADSGGTDGVFVS